MQPNRATTHWGAMATVVTIALALTVVVLVLAVFAVVFGGGGGGTDDDALSDHACVTIDRPSPADDDFSRDGSVLRATVSDVVCRPHDELDHPRAVQALIDVRSFPIVLAVLAGLVGLRRVIERTRDDGPFSSEAVRLIRQLRWWAAGFVLVGTTGSWALRGVANDLVANESWPENDSFWPVVGTFVALSVAAGLCEFGTTQRMTAFDRGRSTDDV